MQTEQSAVVGAEQHLDLHPTRQPAGMQRRHLKRAQEVAFDRPHPQGTKAAFHTVRRLKQVLAREVDGDVALRRCAV
jgi:hypothetical protein